VAQIILYQVIERLDDYFGKPSAPKVNGPWEMILWENVAYLANDEERTKAFQMLKKRIGADPARILTASGDALLEVAQHGVMAAQFAEKLRRCARIVLEEFDGDLRPVLKLSLAKAKKALEKFPGIGEPGAEKILLFTKTQPVLALDSNGLRSLVRLGFGEEKKSYATTYRLVQQAAEPGIKKDCSHRINAHLQLRRHGQQLCRRSNPQCDTCPLAPDCDYYRRQRA